MLDIIREDGRIKMVVLILEKSLKYNMCERTDSINLTQY